MKIGFTAGPRSASVEKKLLGAAASRFCISSHSAYGSPEKFHRQLVPDLCTAGTISAENHDSGGGIICQPTHLEGLNYEKGMYGSQIDFGVILDVVNAFLQ